MLFSSSVYMYILVCSKVVDFLLTIESQVWRLSPVTSRHSRMTKLRHCHAYFNTIEPAIFINFILVSKWSFNKYHFKLWDTFLFVHFRKSSNTVVIVQEMHTEGSLGCWQHWQNTNTAIAFKSNKLFEIKMKVRIAFSFSTSILWEANFSF